MNLVRDTDEKGPLCLMLLRIVSSVQTASTKTQKVLNNVRNAAVRW